MEKTKQISRALRIKEWLRESIELLLCLGSLFLHFLFEIVVALTLSTFFITRNMPCYVNLIAYRVKEGNLFKRATLHKFFAIAIYVQL